MKFLLIVFVIFFAKDGLCTDPKLNVTEMKCSSLLASPPLVVDWITGHDKFYFPVWNAVTMHRIGTDAWGAKEMQNATVAKLLEAPCSIWKPTNTSDLFGKPVHYDSVMNTTNIMWKNNGTEIWRNFKFVKADNSSYILGTNCFEDGEAGWIAISTNPELDKPKIQEITDFVVGFGFKADNIIQVPAGHCK